MTRGKKAKPSPIIWVLADDRAGNVNQALGVADALGLPYQEKRIGYTATAALPNTLRGASLIGVDARTRAELLPPWPDVVIAAGRRTAPVARWIRRQSKGDSALVQLMDPGPGGRDEFALIAVPNHDSNPPSATNVLRVTGAPHRVTEAALRAAAVAWGPRFEHLPRPWTAVIVGGATKDRPFTDGMAAEFGARVRTLAEEGGGSLLVTTSRRTGRSQEAAFLGALGAAVPRTLYRWGDAGDNPYLGYLALADVVVVTGDSVSMCSEACASGKPVYIFAPPGVVAPKHARLHSELYAAGLARPLVAGGGGAAFVRARLDPAREIAAAVRTKLRLG